MQKDINEPCWPVGRHHWLLAGASAAVPRTAHTALQEQVRVRAMSSALGMGWGHPVKEAHTVIEASISFNSSVAALTRFATFSKTQTVAFPRH